MLHCVTGSAALDVLRDISVIIFRVMQSIFLGLINPEYYITMTLQSNRNHLPIGTAPRPRRLES